MLRFCDDRRSVFIYTGSVSIPLFFLSFVFRGGLG
jgi:hypothetical protein